MAHICQTKVGNNYHSFGIPLITVSGSIAASTKNKGAYTISSGILEAGQPILVKFVSGNTLSDPIISIDGTTGIDIIGFGACKPELIPANGIVEMLYDGEKFIISNISK